MATLENPENCCQSPVDRGAGRGCLCVCAGGGRQLAGLAVRGAWEPAARGQELVCVGTWTDGTVDADAFEAATRDTTLSYGNGLPGQVWKAGTAMWLSSVEGNQRLPRRAAAQASGLHTALCFPVRSDRGFLGAIEFFASADRPRDARLLATMNDLGL